MDYNLTINRTVKFERKRRFNVKVKVKVMAIMAKEVVKFCVVQMNIVLDCTENFIVVISTICVVQNDDSWRVDILFL